MKTSESSKERLIAYILLGILVGVLLTNLWKGASFTLTPVNFVILSICVICFMVAIFIIEAANSKGTSRYSFGLPQGTIRATLAIILILFFILVSIYVIETSAPAEKKDLMEKVLTTLATLAIAAVSFYFGVKSTEQGSDIANRIFREVSKSSLAEAVPAMIIQEALKKNKDVWLKEYGCRDIRLGKKQTSDGQVNLDCLVFFVDKKMEPSTLGKTSTKSIPATIQFEFQEKLYSIPTDVRPYSEAEGQQTIPSGQFTENDFIKLDPDAQKGLIREFIRVNASDLIKKYPEIQGITDFKKISGDTQKEYYAIQFKVAIKDTNISSANMLPKSFEFDNGTGKKHTIPTDVIEEGILDESVWHGTAENPKKLGLSVSTFNSPFTGTIGLKVFWEGKYCLMTCCHVLFKQDILSDPTATSFSGNGKEATSPSMKDKQSPNDEKIGKLLKGWYDRSLDIALAEIESGTVINQLYKKNKDVAGIRKIVSENDNGTKVKLFGRTSHDSYGKIVDFSQPVTKIKNSGRLIDDLIVCNFHSQPGDSGGLVLEESTNKIIGILVASSEIFSYVIRIQYIIDFLKIKKENNPWLI